MQKAELFIQEKLAQRARKGILRKLPAPVFPTDFSSNDYLGFARSAELKTRTENTLRQIPDYQNGATGSRLLSGNHPFTEQTEQYIAGFHQAEAGLIFNSGYDANVGLLSGLGQRGDTIICDELIHASLIDGARLSHANRYSFEHNNLGELEAKLKAAKGCIYVVVESIYSMDGDMAPLPEINELCRKYQANLIVDEAHALGIFGPNGCGIVQQFGLQNQVFARIVTFGKAMGCHGAIVLGSRNLREYLVNFARSFIYTTAAPIHTIAAVRSAYQMLEQTDYPLQIGHKITHYLNLIRQTALPNTPSTSAVHTILYQSGAQAKAAAAAVQAKGLDVKAILSPTVAEGKERLRICLHLFNTDTEIATLVKALKAISMYE
ncbi:aminotransferase class I/II-fold pyridoxal phosphate-dependent enzyme [Pedobacter heparinus]|uniref:aminotransferase class I/II-fold pyridoxal phosphate-dependent enzyme n=1 Tax=Pedobacter heparinus TaxID=984 RepID=UPI00292ECC6E|nr:aminotransferase class I/II-fold pyridoxal phosphate-dependent enzyme [Pedobacter heparinus]